MPAHEAPGVHRRGQRLAACLEKRGQGGRCAQTAALRALRLWRVVARPRRGGRRLGGLRRPAPTTKGKQRPKPAALLLRRLLRRVLCSAAAAAAHGALLLRLLWGQQCLAVARGH